MSAEAVYECVGETGKLFSRTRPVIRWTEGPDGPVGWVSKGVKLVEATQIEGFAGFDVVDPIVAALPAPPGWQVSARDMESPNEWIANVELMGVIVHASGSLELVVADGEGVDSVSVDSNTVRLVLP